MNRRRYLQTGIATLATGILAGCSNNGGGSSGGGGGETSGGSGGGGETSGGSGGGGETSGESGEATTSGGSEATTGGGGGTATTGGESTTGGGEMTTGGSMTTGGGATQSSATVNVRSDEEFGDILVGPNGRSLYLLTSDSEGKSTCSSAKCTDIWPPLTTQNPQKGDGVTAKLGTLTRKGGSTQVQVAGHPLYYYKPDEKPGDTKGQEIESFGGEWYLLKPDGSEAEEKNGGSTEMTSSMNTTTTAGSSGSGSEY